MTRGDGPAIQWRRDFGAANRCRAAGSAGLLMLVVALAGCQSMADVQPGTGQRATITGHTYDEVWSAAVKVANAHFAIHEEAKAEGVIRGERRGIGDGWIGIYLTGAGAKAFTVEVVQKGKYRGQISWQDWEKRVLRELQDVLAGRSTR
jgi:hypothetical protein